MKKITLKALGVALLAFAGFATANAQEKAVLGTWDGSAFTAGGLINVNPNESLSFAIQVPAGSPLLPDLDATVAAGVQRTIAITAFRHQEVLPDGPATNFTNHETNLTPVGNHIYVLEDFDAVGAAPLASGLTGALHTGYLVAEIGGDFWWDDNTVAPGDNYLYVGTYTVPGPSFEDNAETVDIVKIGTWLGDGGMNTYAMADVDGVVKIVLDEGQDSVKWYQIPAGGIEGIQAYYYKNVATGKYIVTGATIEDGTDWKLKRAVTAAEKTTNAKWMLIASRWSDVEGRGYLASEDGFVTSDYEDASNKPFIALSFFTAEDGIFGEKWGIVGPDAPVNSPGPGGNNAWAAVALTTVETGVENPDYVAAPEGEEFEGTFSAVDATTLSAVVANPNAGFTLAGVASNALWKSLLDREITTEFDEGGTGYYALAVANLKTIIGEDTAALGLPLGAGIGRDGRLRKAPAPAPAYTYFADVPAVATAFPAGTTGKIQFDVLIGAMADWNYWWDQSIADGALITKVSIDFEAQEVQNGIYDLAADGSTVVGYYSILGAKLSQEPASGVFIVKYSNGKAVKVVK